MAVARDVAQAEIYQSDPQQAESAEQGGVGMIEGEKGPMLIIIDQRRVEGAAAKHAGADEIPERRPDDIEIGQIVFELLMGGISR